MLRYLLGLGLIALLLACHEDDTKVYKREQVVGSAVLTDLFSESLTIPASTATIYLADNEKADPFLYTVSADDKGKFTLYGLPGNSAGLVVVGKYKNAAGITFMGSKLISLFSADPLTELPLTPQYPGGVLKFLLTDASADNKPIVGADVLLFTTKSQTAAATDNDPKGVAYKSVTNAKGIAFFSSLLPVTYYAVAKNTINGKTTLSSVMETPVSSTVLVTNPTSVQSLTFTYPAPAAKASLIIRLKDKLNQPVAGFNAYLFVNLEQANTIKDDNPKGFVQGADMVTDRNGVTKFSNLEPGDYYIAISGVYSPAPALPVRKVITSQPISVTAGSGITVPDYIVN